MNSKPKSVLICGGGAAGFFTAVNIAEKHPKYQITILEKSNKVLSKVRISGGGRCNVTNARSKPSELVKFYPRGEKKLYKTFQNFSTSDMMAWLEKRGVKTKIEADLRVFPVTDNSETIIKCFLMLVDQYKIQLAMNDGLESFEQTPEGWRVHTQKHHKYLADILVIATGSSNVIWQSLQKQGFKINPPVPSLFTFNIKDPRLTELMGVSFEWVSTRIAGTKLKEEGPLLITHWGLSGPAILKLSAWGARELEAKNYKFKILINFTSTLNFDQCKAALQQIQAENPKKKVINYPQYKMPKRYWERLCTLAGIGDQLTFNDLGNKLLNKLTEELTQATFEVNGKSTFKDEFVTCGGIDLSEVDLDTFQSKRFPGLYFTGEILDIDAITGGFNFQSCWSSAWVISESV